MGAVESLLLTLEEQKAVDRLITDSTNSKSNIQSITATRVLDPFGNERIIFLIGEIHKDAKNAVMHDFLKAMCNSTTRVDFFVEEVLEKKVLYQHPQEPESTTPTGIPLNKARVRARMPCKNIRSDPVDARGFAFHDVYEIKAKVEERYEELITPLDDLAISVYFNAFLNTKRLCQKYLKLMPESNSTTKVLQAYFDAFFVVPIDQNRHPLYPEFIIKLEYNEVEEQFAFLMDIYCVFRMMRKRSDDNGDARLVFYAGDRHARSIQEILHTCVAANGTEPMDATITSWRQQKPSTELHVAYIHEKVRKTLNIEVAALKPQQFGEKGGGEGGGGGGGAGAEADTGDDSSNDDSSDDESDGGDGCDKTQGAAF